MKTMPWELLVTEGHVRAARLRSIAVPFLIAATALLASGIAWRLSGPRLLYPSVSTESALIDRVQRSRQAALKSITGMAPLSLSDDEVGKLPPTDQLPAVLKLLRDALRTTGEPPSGVAIATVADPADFWSGKWPGSKIAYLNKGDLRAFGVVAASKQEVFDRAAKPRPYRWLAIFRKNSSVWDDIAIQADGFIVPSGEAATSPEYIPVSLEMLGLPELAR